MTEIIYNETTEQWQELAKNFHSDWDQNTGEYTVYCTDGMITKNGVETKYSTGLEFELNEDGESYSVVGIGTCEETEIVIPAIHEGKRVTAIGEYAFANYSTSFSITIPNTVTSIESYAFTFCNLNSISIPDSVTSIGDYAFSYCYGLTKITIPDSVTSIGSRAFSYSNKLTEIFYQGSIAQWKEIEKDSHWDADSSISCVYCEDGALRGKEYF